MNQNYFKIAILSICVFFMFISINGITSVFDIVNAVQSVDFNGCWIENGESVCTPMGYYDPHGNIVQYSKPEIVQEIIDSQYGQLPLLVQILVITISAFVRFFMSLVNWVGLRWMRILNTAFWTLYFGFFASSLFSI